MNAAGDYSAAYCILHTDSGLEGHGMVSLFLCFFLSRFDQGSWREREGGLLRIFGGADLCENFFCEGGVGSGEWRDGFVTISNPLYPPFPSRSEERRVGKECPV